MDINYHVEFYDIIQMVTSLKKPIFSFDVTNHCEIEGDCYCFRVEDIDDMIAVAVETFADIKEQLERCGFYQGDVFALTGLMNKKFRPEYEIQIKNSSVFY